MKAIQGKNQCLVKHRLFCFKPFRSAVEVVLREHIYHEAASFGSAMSPWFRYMAMGAVRLSAKEKISLEVKGSLFVLLY